MGYLPWTESTGQWTWSSKGSYHARRFCKLPLALMSLRTDGTLFDDFFQARVISAFLFRSSRSKLCVPCESRVV